MAAVLAAVIVLTAFAETAPEPYGWAVVYKGQVCNKNPTIGIFVATPTITSSGTYIAQPCIYGYVEGTITEWFMTEQAAMDRVNGKSILFGETLVACPNCSNAMGADQLIGVFHAERLALHQVQVGSHKESVQRMDEIDVPTMEWKP
jgi:hypothetical protein